MKKVESYEQIQKFVRDVRLLRNGFVTNFYWDPNKHPYWIAEGSLEYEKTDNCVLMVRKQDTFANLFYIATDYNAVSNILEHLNVSGIVVVDIVCRGDGEKDRQSFMQMGFKVHKHLYRMTHSGQMATLEWSKDKRVEFGSNKDTEAVFNILHRDFDHLAEQLPTLKEIEDFVERNQLLVIKDKDQLCGFLIFEITGQSWYLRYWYTSPNYRNKGIGAGLLRTSLIYGIETKRQMFWVVSENDNAIKRYEHYGFTRENMNDYVMIK